MVKQKIGRTGDPDLARLATKINTAIQSYRKAISGAAFTVPESKEYRNIFPSITRTDELNTATIGALKEVLQGNVDFTLESILGSQAYDDIFRGNALLEGQEGTDISDINLKMGE